MRISSTLRRTLLLLLAAAIPLIATASPDMQTLHVQADMLDGSRFTLAGSRDTVVLLAIWSPDSLASRKSIGELDRFAAAYRSRGIATIAASTLRDADALRQFSATRGLGLPIAMLGDHTLGRLPEQNLPIVYVFDRNGALHARRDGLVSLRVLEHLVAPLLGH